MKHLNDDGLSNISVEQAREEIERGNKRRMKSSLLFKSPEAPTSDRQNEVQKRRENNPSTNKNPAMNRERIPGNYVPPKRNEVNLGASTSAGFGASSNSWRPDKRPSTDMDTE